MDSLLLETGDLLLLETGGTDNLLLETATGGGSPAPPGSPNPILAILLPYLRRRHE